MDTRREVEHFRLFSVFLAAGLVDMSSESLNFSNVSNDEKKMAFRLGQHLLRANSKSENFGLFALYSRYFFISMTHPILITAIALLVFGTELEWERLGLYT